MSRAKAGLYRSCEAIGAHRTRSFYSKVIERLRRSEPVHPIKVIFLVNESSKWKVQSVYDEMKSSGRYELLVALTMADIDRDLDSKALEAKFSENERFFSARGIRTVRVYDVVSMKPLSLEALKPDIVFYPHPWGLPGIHMPGILARQALTCYVPYFVPTFGNPEMHCFQPVHKQVFRHFVLNEDWEQYYRSAIQKSLYAGEIVGIGHPMLDAFRNMPTRNNGPVIYAPHWSIPNDKFDTFLNLSTFLLNGQKILAYAKSHPEIKWAFKPHPTLRSTILKIGAMTEVEIDAYYKEWERIGEACYTGDYVELFARSRALVTDCDSFLSEYPCTGKPIIHLISPVKSRRTFSPMQALFNSYYQVHDDRELEFWFRVILEEGDDPYRSRREAALKASGLVGHSAAKAIVEHLEALYD